MPMRKPSGVTIMHAEAATTWYWHQGQPTATRTSAGIAIAMMAAKIVQNRARHQPGRVKMLPPPPGCP